MIFIAFICVFSKTKAQIPTIQWQKCLGGTENDRASTIKQTTDGGYIVLATTKSNNGDVIGWHGNNDCWVIKLNSFGNVQWQKCIGGAGNDNGNDIIFTTDGGYIIAGDTDSNDGDVTGNHGPGSGSGYFDAWLVKLSSTGTIQWQKCYGGNANESAQEVKQTSDGGYIFCGYTNLSNGDVTGFHGGSGFDFWVVKTSSTGTIQWQKCLGGSGDDQSRSIVLTNDGGYIVTGYTVSFNGDITLNNGFTDIWLVKLSSTGVIQWQKCYGGSGSETSDKIITTSDGGYLISGSTDSNGGNVSGFNGGSNDIWVLKITSTGILQWQKCIGGSSSESVLNVLQLNNGNYSLFGYTSSNSFNNYHGGQFDVLLFEISTTGNVLWNNCFGGSSTDIGQYHGINNNGNYYFCGYSGSNNMDVSGNHNTSFPNDVWVAQLCNPSYSIDTVVSCQSYTWINGITYNSNNYAATYTYNNASASGCDSIVQLHLTINHPSITIDSVDACNSYTWINGQTYNSSNNTATYTIANGSVNGCDSIIELNLHIYNDETIWISDSSYNSYTYNGQVYYNSGVYLVDSSLNANGCQTFVYLDLIIYNSGMIEKGTMGIISISPNPTSDNISIKINENFIKQQYFIYDQFGRKTLESRFEAIENEVDLSQFKSGIYFLKVEGSSETNKIIKN